MSVNTSHGQQRLTGRCNESRIRPIFEQNSCQGRFYRLSRLESRISFKIDRMHQKSHTATNLVGIVPILKDVRQGLRVAILNRLMRRTRHY